MANVLLATMGVVVGVGALVVGARFALAIRRRAALRSSKYTRVMQGNDEAHEHDACELDDWRDTGDIVLEG